MMMMMMMMTMMMTRTRRIPIDAVIVAVDGPAGGRGGGALLCHKDHKNSASPKKRECTLGSLVEHEGQ